MSRPDDFNELESLLRELPMRQPSQMLGQRVSVALSDAAEELAARPGGIRRHALIWASAAAMVIAASSVTVLMLSRSQPHPDTGPIAQDNRHEQMALTLGPNSASKNQPVIQPINLVWSRDTSDQLLYTPSGKPYRSVVRQTIDQRVWIDPDTGARMQVTKPREELYVVEQPVY